MVTDSPAAIDKLLQIPLYVPGKRAQTLAGSLGFASIILADNATDPAMLEALQQHL